MALDPEVKTKRLPMIVVTCHVCNGEGYVQVFAYNGDQTKFTVRCPNCAGFGRVGRET